ncbi:MAG: hypothetical protein HKN57_10200 [Xanthomonadales bacterium]|nr:spondin domain-containing protein [Gammaproteobacteria bacterium]MBT8054544.1 spondin domain-containing protein [Gammaproteobacteria bacterium]NND57616.1 hypothetical protein [Xanthomonadales bacterium]NNK51340.1 hypothetical protein [Xanthomonadales bacterium]NNL94219.1 hypothetical protein [Xanthomonadales bacterium]
MKVLNFRNALLGVTLVVASAMLSPVAMANGKDRLYQVTITNATLGQPVAPSVIATHDGSFRLFELGAAPMPGDGGYADYFALAAMAETGYPFHVLDQVAASTGVWEAKVLATSNTPPVIFPGGFNSTTISASGNAKYLSSVGMLGATNDAVYAVRGVMLPRGIGDTVHVSGSAYDAGSEANAESADTVGALGATDEDPVSGVGINEGGEGYIHVHAGIHGVGGMGGLSAAVHDWRNPVVEVTIERIE